jgi:hypothetical protein
LRLARYAQVTAISAPLNIKIKSIKGGAKTMDHLDIVNDTIKNECR